MTPHAETTADRADGPFAGPDFIVIGAMKCGTSSLWRYLDAHPAITMSNPKETDFFIDPDWAESLDWYRRCFERDGVVPRGLLGEASPNYTKSHVFPGVADRMAQLCPEAKLVYVVRDPVERIRSHYLHNVAAGRERQPFDSVIDAASGYVRTSMYAAQLREYLRHFPADAIKVVDAAALDIDTRATVGEILGHLGVTTEGLPVEVLRGRHHRSSDKNISPLDRRLRSGPVRAVANVVVPRPVRSRVRLDQITRLFEPLLPRAWTTSSGLEDVVVTETQRRGLTDILGPDVEELRSLTGLDLATWSI